ncbi:MAG: DUF1330 domain-containing protein, partial [Woeseiaceae bacterium]
SNSREKYVAAFFIASVTIKNSDKFQEYSERAKETFSAHDGELLARGKLLRGIVGNADHQAVGIVRFPSEESLMDWFQSEEYQSIVPLRDESADMTILTYTEPA